MYKYDDIDERIVAERVAQFRDQVARRLSGEISEDEFKPIRLQNGLYLQLHAYMLRVSIPYGLMSSDQLRMLASIARRYDRNYGHFSTRQNLQYNWIRLVDMPDILADLASVEMHAIQTSGNCIRNITADHLAGVARDELEDPRPIAEIIRQWSTFHPEFAFLPRKFKIALTGAPSNDRAAVRVHDIGIRIVERAPGERGFEIWVGGGLGRTPIIGEVVRDFVPRRDLLSYLEAILRVYNRWGRRDNKFKARIKILVQALGIDEFRKQVDAEWALIKDGELVLDDAEVERVKAHFSPPTYESLPNCDALVAGKRLSPNREFARWVQTNVVAHKVPGYVAVLVSLKTPGIPPGDVTSEQMEAIAALADEIGFSQIVATHTQNLVLPDVPATKLELVWERLRAHGLSAPNVGTAADIIACPGLDYCSLANARSIPVAQRIALRFDDEALERYGDVSIKISGCINACGHHHVGNIGLLGIDKNGEEFYQLTLGGSPSDDVAIGKILGPAIASADVVEAIERVLETYVALRSAPSETFLQTYRRVGPTPFKESVYATNPA
jgi:sulfite reductase (NADPH) hemoprotein beta-component